MLEQGRSVREGGGKKQCRATNETTDTTPSMVVRAYRLGR